MQRVGANLCDLMRLLLFKRFEKHLQLRDKLHNCIQEIHPTIGEDTAILDRSEQLNEEAMFAIYEKNGGQLSLCDNEEDDWVDLNEAEQLRRQLREENPSEYERISSLRDGIRTAKSSGHKGLYVFRRAGNYQKLYLADAEGEIVSSDIPCILAAIKCLPDEKGENG